MILFLVRRVLLGALVLWIITVAVFVLFSAGTETGPAKR